MAGECGTRVDGPLEPFRDDVEQALRALGYSEGRVAQLLLLMAHLSRWLAERGSTASDLTDETVKQFFIGLRVHHRRCRSSRSLAPMLEHLRAIGVVPIAEVVPTARSAEEELLASFGHYLREQRGLGATTVEAYQNYARGCIRMWWPGGIVAPAELDAAEIIAVVRSSVDAMRPPSLRCMVTALRALLRFFNATGRTSRSLVEGARRPRPHDVRHSFAVTSLVAWYRAAEDVQARLPALSAYLGHVEPKDTYWYYSDSRVIPTPAPSRA